MDFLSWAISLKNVYTANSINTLPLSNTKGKPLIVHYTLFSLHYLNVPFTWCPDWVLKDPWVLPSISIQLRPVQQNFLKTVHNMANISVINKLSFVFLSGGSFLLLTSMKPKQAYLLACKWCEMLASSLLFTFSSCP